MSEALGWRDAALAADLLALDPRGLGGARLRGRPGPGRDAFLARLRAGMPAAAPVRRVPAHAGEDALVGGLDLAATLAAGRPISRRGLLAEADGGVAVLAMAERAKPAAAAQLAAALDDGAVAVERDGVSARAPARLALVALDEGEDADEAAPAALRDRMAFDLAVGAMRPGPCEARDVAAARAAWPAVAIPDALIEAVCAAAAALGVASPRATLFATRVMRAAAALDGRAEAGEDDARLAARLVLGPRATQLPAPPEEETPEPEQQPEPPPPQDGAEEPPCPSPEALTALTDVLLEAAKATLPPGVLAGLTAQAAARAGADGGGAAGALARSATRGRPIGTRPGRPGGGARLDLVETLRAAAPWQPLRRREAGEKTLGRVLVRRQDFRLKRFKRPTETLTLFVVDASGSAAAQRLAEAKGAVELLLGDSYARRDRVALITFRGASAELALPPTRALARAKRVLAGLPGGGGTPLAAALDRAVVEAEAARRRGWSVGVVLLTDGRANVARDGAGGRARAATEALEAAAALRALGVGAVVIDSGARPTPAARTLADAMGARFLPLPRADGAALRAAAEAC